MGGSCPLHPREPLSMISPPIVRRCHQLSIQIKSRISYRFSYFIEVEVEPKLCTRHSPIHCSRRHLSNRLVDLPVCPNDDSFSPQMSERPSPQSKPSAASISMAPPTAANITITCPEQLVNLIATYPLRPPGPSLSFTIADAASLRTWAGVQSALECYRTRIEQLNHGNGAKFHPGEVEQGTGPWRGQSRISETQTSCLAEGNRTTSQKGVSFDMDSLFESLPRDIGRDSGTIDTMTNTELVSLLDDSSLTECTGEDGGLENSCWNTSWPSSAEQKTQQTEMVVKNSTTTEPGKAHNFHPLPHQLSSTTLDQLRSNSSPTPSPYPHQHEWVPSGWAWNPEGDGSNPGEREKAFACADEARSSSSSDEERKEKKKKKKEKKEKKKSEEEKQRGNRKNKKKEVAPSLSEVAYAGYFMSLAPNAQTHKMGSSDSTYTSTHTSHSNSRHPAISQEPQRQTFAYTPIPSSTSSSSQSSGSPILPHHYQQQQQQKARHSLGFDNAPWNPWSEEDESHHQTPVGGMPSQMGWASTNTIVSASPGTAHGQYLNYFAASRNADTNGAFGDEPKFDYQKYHHNPPAFLPNNPRLQHLPNSTRQSTRSSETSTATLTSTSTATTNSSGSSGSSSRSTPSSNGGFSAHGSHSRKAIPSQFLPTLALQTPHTPGGRRNRG